MPTIVVSTTRRIAPGRSWRIVTRRLVSSLPVHRVKARLAATSAVLVTISSTPSSNVVRTKPAVVAYTIRPPIHTSPFLVLRTLSGWSSQVRS